MAVRVRIKQMVGAGIVLVDRLLDEPHAEDTRVEIEVFLRRSGNRRDVMKSVDALHDASPVPLPMYHPDRRRFGERVRFDPTLCRGYSVACSTVRWVGFPGCHEWM